MRTGKVRGRPWSPLRVTLLSCAALLAPVGRAAACDVCAVYTAVEVGERRQGLRVGVAEQLTQYGTLQRNGSEVPNPADERLTSSITQVLLGWNFGPRWGVQLNLPIVSRTFRRRHDGGVEHGDETGVGDLTLLAHVLAASHVTEHSVFRFTVLGGLELPTGSTDRLREELAEPHAAAVPLRTRLGGAIPQHAAHGGGEEGEESGIHGHDLALGSGSVDGLVGAQLFWSWRRVFAIASGQYLIRTEGDFDYQYADELHWSAGPGVFALLDHRYSLGLQALVTGETKGKDTIDGLRADDTAITALYAGPGLTFTWGASLVADLIAEIPAVQHNTALQIVPDYRLRGGVTWRF